jgi:uncharacterized protein YecE (DUF72 family)
MDEPDNLRIGTSGWNYLSGPGAWKGVFYPLEARRHGRGRVFDDLAYYAERFDTVEVNSTFYGQPRAEVTAGWVARTPSYFEFSVKLFQKFTHPGMYQKGAKGASGARSTAGARSASGARGASGAKGASKANRASSAATSAGEGSTVISQSDLDEFRAGIDPLARAGKLGALLAQFPASFKDTPESRESLDRLLRAFRDYPVAVELRHRSWSDHVAETLTLLNEYGAAWTQIDEPKFKFSIRQNLLPNVKSFYYMRLHGRNAAKWWRHETRDDRYDYLYTERELKPFAETAQAARTLVRKMYLYLNNHFAAKSVANALMIKKQVGQPIQGTYTPELVERYPELKAFVPTSAGLPLPLLS